jgi:hypothetical protein
MVTPAETTSGRQRGSWTADILSAQRQRGTSISSTASAVTFIDQRSWINDQNHKPETSGELLGEGSTNAAGVTNYTAAGLSAATTYYFELLPTGSSGPAVATASATTFGGNVGGSGSYTAPTITQQAAYSQPDPNDVTLTMAATGQNGDPISYLWQLLSSPSNAQAPSFDPGYQTVTAQVFVAGNYVFMGTATDQANGLSTTSSVTATVKQTPTSIQVSPQAQEVGLGKTLLCNATELDQFGDVMDKQPGFAWSVTDTSIGTVDASGLFTASSSKEGLTIVQASADGLTGTTPVMATGSNLTTISFGNLPVGTVVTNQFPGVTFSAPSGFTDEVFNDPPMRLGDFQGSSYAFSQGLTLTFANPVDDLSFITGYFDSAPGTVVGSVSVYTNGSFAGTVNIVSPGNLTNGSVDLSAYHNITSIVIGPNTDPAGLGYTSFSFQPQSLGIALGDDSTNQVLQGNGNDMKNLTPLHLFVPSDLPGGTTVALTDSQPGEVDAWNSANPQTGDTPLLGTGTGSVTWTVGSQNVPSTLWVGVEHGSASFGDIQFTLAVTPPGQRTITADTTPATAKPVVPTDVKLTYIPSVGVAPENTDAGANFTPARVKISWSDNDSSVWFYKIFRSSDGGTNYTFVGLVNGKTKTYTDTTLSDTNTAGPWKYKIVAVNAVGTSTSTHETVHALGGPDITANLLQIGKYIYKAYDSFTPVQQTGFKAAFYNISNAMGDWDIVPLAGQYVNTLDSSGVLPNGEHTVTVNGGVYNDDYVNYFLYGVWARIAGANEDLTEDKIAGYRVLRSLWMHEGTGIDGRLAWFRVGYYYDFDTFAGDGVPHVDPSNEIYTQLLSFHLGIAPFAISGSR